MSKLFVDEVLPICCSAFNLAGGYTNNKKYEATHIVKNTIAYPVEQYENVPCCTVTDDDIKTAKEIKEYCLKHFMISVLGYISDTESWANAYEKKMYDILNNDVLLRRDISRLTRLPEYYITHKTQYDIKRKTKFIDSTEHLSNSSVINNTECEVINVVKTKNYSGYNVTGIINNCLVTWYSCYILDVGNYMIEKAVVKEQQFSYYANKSAYKLTNVTGFLIK